MIEALTVVEEGTQSEDSEEVQGDANALIDEVGEQVPDSEESDD